MPTVANRWELVAISPTLERLVSIFHALHSINRSQRVYYAGTIRWDMTKAVAHNEAVKSASVALRSERERRQILNDCIAGVIRFILLT